MTDPQAAVREALTELVALKTLEAEANAIHFAGPFGPTGEDWGRIYQEKRREYLRRWPLALEAAERALALPLEPEKPSERRVALIALKQHLREKMPDLPPSWFAALENAALPTAPGESAPKPLDDPRLQELFSSAISGALAFGAQGVNPPPEGHWLTQFWQMARAERELSTSSQALTALRAVIAHWHEFGQEHGFEEIVDRAERAIVPFPGEPEKPVEVTCLLSPTAGASPTECTACGLDPIPAHCPTCQPVDVEDLIASCVPGGSVCDPQQVADAIRGYFGTGQAVAPSAVELTDEQIDAIDTFSLHWMAPRGRESVRDFARALLAAAKGQA